MVQRIRFRGRTYVLVVLCALVTGLGALAWSLNTSATASALTTYTRSVSCAGTSFYPAESQTTYMSNGSLRMSTAGGDFAFHCDPGLPHGGVVTRVRFTFDDSSISGWAGPCSLRRASLGLSAATVQVMANVPSTQNPSNEYPGIIRYGDSTISYPTIDNANFVYWLECYLHGYGGGPNFGLHGAEVTFTITDEKG